MYKIKQVTKEGASTSQMDQEMDIKKIMKDIEFLGSSRMTWKERKELENRKVVSLGGKPPKKQRLAPSVARVTMKKQSKREQKMLQESLILGRFGGKVGGVGAKRTVETGKAQTRKQVLKSSEGHFRNGVLDVKDLLRPAPSRGIDSGSHLISKGKKRRRNGNKNRDKKKDGGKKHH